MQPGQPQMPNFNAKLVLPIPESGALSDSDAELFDADRRLRERYALHGPIEFELALLIADKTNGKIVQTSKVRTGQSFIAVPAVLLDPNLRGTEVMKVVESHVADAIEAHHAYTDAVREANQQQQEAAANE